MSHSVTEEVNRTEEEIDGHPVNGVDFDLGP